MNDVIEVLASQERDRIRRSRLEDLYKALKANLNAQSGTNWVTWKTVLDAVKAVEATDVRTL